MKREILMQHYNDIVAANPVMLERRPLAIGAFDELMALVNDRAIVHDILRWHTRNNKYLRNLIAGNIRFHLDGTEAGNISDEHHQDAAKRLTEYKKKIAAEKKEAKKKILIENPKPKAIPAPKAKPKKTTTPPAVKITIKKRHSYRAAI